MPCLGACETQLYSVLVTNTNYPTKATFKHTTQFCTVVKKLLKSCETRSKSLTKEYKKLCVTIIELKVFHFSFLNYTYMHFAQPRYLLSYALSLSNIISITC